MDSLRHLLRLFFGKGVFSAYQTFRRNPRSTDALPTTDIRHFIISHVAFNWSEFNSIFYPFQWLYVYIPGFQSKNTAEIECWLDDSHRVVAKANSQPPHPSKSLNWNEWNESVSGREATSVTCKIVLNHVESCVDLPPCNFQSSNFPKTTRGKCHKYERCSHCYVQLRKGYVKKMYKGKPIPFPNGQVSDQSDPESEANFQRCCLQKCPFI